MVHADAIYDVEVDTSLASPRECATAILKALADPPEPSAFARLRDETIAVRHMAASELGRIGEIDRSERITQQYKSRAGSLELIDVDIHAPRWGQPGERTVEQVVDSWKRLLDDGGVLLGAFDGDLLVGIAIYLPSSSEGFAQFAVLHVARTYRRKGVGTRLSDAVVRLARAEGAQRIYVSATPTRGTVDFYLTQGFEPLVSPNERLFALEPEDIHMERKL
jgi:GNAT superfamily N-acetyltransferase